MTPGNGIETELLPPGQGFNARVKTMTPGNGIETIKYSSAANNRDLGEDDDSWKRD